MSRLLIAASSVAPAAPMAASLCGGEPTDDHTPNNEHQQHQELPALFDRVDPLQEWYPRDGRTELRLQLAEYVYDNDVGNHGEQRGYQTRRKKFPHRDAGEYGVDDEGACRWNETADRAPCRQGA